MGNLLIDLQGQRVDIYLHSPLKLRSPTEEPCEEDQVGCDDEIARMTARGRCVMRVSSLYAVTESHLVVLQSGDFVANCLLEDSERPKGGFGLKAATVLRPQGPSLIAAVTKTFGCKKIATEIGPFGRNSPFRWLFSLYFRLARYDRILAFLKPFLAVFRQKISFGHTLLHAQLILKQLGLSSVTPTHTVKCNQCAHHHG